MKKKIGKSANFGFSGAIRITLRSMLMSRWRAMHLHANMAACEQAPSSQFGANAHRL
jgi:hypothetical protein